MYLYEGFDLTAKQVHLPSNLVIVLYYHAWCFLSKLLYFNEYIMHIASGIVLTQVFDEAILMATTFGWKKKRPRLQGSSDVGSRNAFAEELQVDPGSTDGVVDWLHSIPVKKQKVQLEDTATKARRLINEGITFAENERYVVLYS